MTSQMYGCGPLSDDQASSDALHGLDHILDVPPSEAKGSCGDGEFFLVGADNGVDALQMARKCWPCDGSTPQRCDAGKDLNPSPNPRAKALRIYPQGLCKIEQRILERKDVFVRPASQDEAYRFQHLG